VTLQKEHAFSSGIPNPVQMIRIHYNLTKKSYGLQIDIQHCSS
jgi:hypothetical protein